jgi:hypothetical protein
MSLVSLPTATLDDSEVARALGRSVAVINPVLDLLAGTDLLGLKKRTHRLGDSDDAISKALDALAWVLNTADVPGTLAWADMDLEDRVDWWVRRVGALDTLLVAFPGVFGVIADRLPVQDLLGFSNQAIVLCAVAREHSIQDRDIQVRLLASVMCDRDLSAAEARGDAGEQAQPEPSDTVLTGRLWHFAGVLRAVNDELVKRHRPRSLFRYLGMLPAVGAVADYLGEYGALVRAAKEGQAWIATHTAVATVT